MFDFFVKVKLVSNVVDINATTQIWLLTGKKAWCLWHRAGLLTDGPPAHLTYIPACPPPALAYAGRPACQHFRVKGLQLFTLIVTLHSEHEIP